MKFGQPKLMQTFPVNRLYWTDQDVLDFLAENSDDEHLKRVRNTNQRAKSVPPSGVATPSGEPDVGSAAADKYKGVQERKSATMKISDLEFDGLRQTEGIENHKIQTIKELQSVPVSFLACLYLDQSS
jgi:protein SSD1